MSKPAPADFPIHDLIRDRWSSRSFANRPVEAAKLQSLLEAARWAPSSFNEQPWSILVATKETPDDFQRLLGCMIESNQGWASAAPVLMLAVAKQGFDRGGQANRHAFHDVGLALGNLTVQATALDLTLHMIAGFYPDRAREVCGIPETHEPAVMLAIGYRGPADVLPEPLRAKELAPRQRKPLAEFVFTGQWGEQNPLVSGEGNAQRAD